MVRQGPVGLGVSRSTDRQVKGKTTPTGVFLEQLETDVSKYLPEVTEAHVGDEKAAISININQSMSDLRAQLSKYPVTTRLSLTGTMVVARDIAHAKILERLEQGLGLPEYIKNHMVYYAGPAKTPEVVAISCKY